ncbi:MAG: hypothetical protein ACD_79C00901G0001 [uncultured bacterium]|nr:MAG: hypothetical protein ACD_79C00901G0001 [uncultured bacterium]
MNFNVVILFLIFLVHINILMAHNLCDSFLLAPYSNYKKVFSSEDFPETINLSQIKTKPPLATLKHPGLNNSYISKNTESDVILPVIIIDEEAIIKQWEKNNLEYYSMKVQDYFNSLQMGEYKNTGWEKGFNSMKNAMLFLYYYTDGPGRQVQSKPDFLNDLAIDFETALFKDEFNFLSSYYKDNYAVIIKQNSNNSIFNGFNNFKKKYSDILSNAKVVISSFKFQAADKDGIDPHKISPNGTFVYYTPFNSYKIEEFLKSIKTGDVIHLSYLSQYGVLKKFVESITHYSNPINSEIFNYVVEEVKHIIRFHPDFKNADLKEPSIFHQILELARERSRIKRKYFRSSFLMAREDQLMSVLSKPIDFLDLFSYHDQLSNPRGMNFAKTHPDKSFVSVGFEFGLSGLGYFEGVRSFNINYDVFSFVKRLNENQVGIVNIDFGLIGEFSTWSEFLNDCFKALNTGGIISLYYEDIKNTKLNNTESDIRKLLQLIGFDFVDFPPVKDVIEDYKSRRYYSTAHLKRVVAVKPKPQGINYKDLLEEYYKYEGFETYSSAQIHRSA